jgi:hypothetical protein
MIEENCVFKFTPKDFSVKISREIENLIETTEICREDLESYVCKGGFIYSDGHDSEVFEEWDEQEEYEAKKNALIDDIENCRISVPDKWKKAFEENPKLKERVKKYLVNIIKTEF